MTPIMIGSIAPASMTIAWTGGLLMSGLAGLAVASAAALVLAVWRSERVARRRPPCPTETAFAARADRRAA